MSLQSRLNALIVAIGADIKSIRADVAAIKPVKSFVLPYSLLSTDTITVENYNVGFAATNLAMDGLIVLDGMVVDS